MITVTLDDFKANTGTFIRLLREDDLLLTDRRAAIGVLIHPSRMEKGKDAEVRRLMVEHLERMIELLKE